MARRSKFGRFQVWNQGSDSWKHTDQAYNLDVLDQMIGGTSQTATKGVGDDFNNPTTTAPTGPGQWLHPQDTTQITNFGNRTLFNIVRALDFNDVPLGAVFAWWRPSSDVPLPTGCVPCDGSTYSSTATHSYQPYGITSITVPDMRNKMVLGANTSVTDGTAAALPSVQAASGAPGIRGGGGTNVPRALSHTHLCTNLTIADHRHPIGIHQHEVGTHTHPVNAHQHNIDITHSHSVGGGGNTGISGNTVTVKQGSAGPDVIVSHKDHYHTTFMTITGSTSGGPTTLNTANDGATLANVGTGTTGNPASAGSTTGYAATPGLNWNSYPPIGGSTQTPSTGIAPTEIMPQYYGLLWMVKVLKAGPLYD